MKLIKSKKGIAALLVTLAVVAFASVGAYAYFSNTGTGTDNAAVSVGSVAHTGSWAVSFGTTTYAGDGCPACSLLPTTANDPNKVVATVPFTVTNSSEADEHLVTWSASVDPASLTTGCSASDFSVGGELPGVTHTVGSLDVTLQPHSDAGTAGTTSGNHYSNTVSVQMIESNSNQDACQGQTPALIVSAASA